MKFKQYLSLILITIFLTCGNVFATDLTIKATEEMVGSGHTTKTDTLNRLVLVEHNTDGSHKNSSTLPTGTVFAFAGNSCPSGSLEGDGTAISRTTYANLYAVISTMYGVGDGSTTFNKPDYRGRFLRGWAHGQTTDPDRATRTNRGDGTTGDHVGTKQEDGLESHLHTYSGVINPSAGGGSYLTGQSLIDYIGSTSFNSGTTGGNETRPTNINVIYCIKY